ncbi:hypothetical protein [Demequina soli]|uniref:hypothetical protein n=1 Tax=Demequina soli TaxID=1638987 RepID=UPI0007810605|nr:hypothetical protein [Demequina soli]
MPHRPSLRALAVAAVAAPLLAGCSGAPVYPILASVAPAAAPDAVLASRSVDVTLSTAVDEDVVVTGGMIFSPYFDRLDAIAVDKTVVPGEPLTIRLPLGAATCPAGEGPSSAQLVLDVGGEELVQTVLLEGDHLATLNSDACALVPINQG